VLNAKVIEFGTYRDNCDGRINAPANVDFDTCEFSPMQPPLIIPEELRETQSMLRLGRKRWLLPPIAASMSVTLHAGLVAFLVLTPLADGSGIGGQDLETVSVEIVSSVALESLMAPIAADSGGASAPTDAATGTNATIDQAEIAAETKMTAQEPIKVQAEALLKPDFNPGTPSETATADVIRPDPKPPVSNRATDKGDVTTELGKDQSTVAAQASSVAGGTASQAAAETIATQGQASASAGQLSKFAVEVRIALGRSRPKHDGTRGHVSVFFGLTEDGGLRFAEIAKSSGSDRLDRSAIKAINAAKLPRPPVGLTDSQRTYTVPFEFK
jgi:periplasmic protein TonB